MSAWRWGTVTRLLVYSLIFSASVAGQPAKVVINDQWPIQSPSGASVLSPPHVEPTNQCSKSVYVDSFIPHATITVFLNGLTVIGGPTATDFGFTDVP